MRASEWLLLAACAGLLVIGPAMAYQEMARSDAYRRELDEARARAELTNTPEATPEPDYTYREPWRWPLFALVVLSGVTGSLVLVRLARRRRLRSVAGRLLGLLLLGMTLVDVAFLLDVQWAFGQAFLARGWSVVWLYPVGAVLIAGSLYRITELEPHFGSDEAPAPVLLAPRPPS